MALWVTLRHRPSRSKLRRRAGACGPAADWPSESTPDHDWRGCTAGESRPRPMCTTTSRPAGRRKVPFRVGGTTIPDRRRFPGSPAASRRPGGTGRRNWRSRPGAERIHVGKSRIRSVPMSERIAHSSQAVVSSTDLQRLHRRIGHHKDLLSTERRPGACRATVAGRCWSGGARSPVLARRCSPRITCAVLALRCSPRSTCPTV